MDCSLPGFSVHGIFQARVLEWVAISFSRRSSQPGHWTPVSRIVGRHFTLWATREAPATKKIKYWLFLQKVDNEYVVIYHLLWGLTAWWLYWWPPKGLLPRSARPRAAAARVPVPVTGHCWPVPPKETLRHSKAGLAQSLQGLWVLVCTRLCLSPQCLWQVQGLILNTISCWGFSFALECGISLSGGIQHSPIDCSSAASCNFEVIAGENERTSFYSTILVSPKGPSSQSYVFIQWSCVDVRAGL